MDFFLPSFIQVGSLYNFVTRC